jgi:CHASE3 domain sensor protein
MGRPPNRPQSMTFGSALEELAAKNRPATACSGKVDTDEADEVIDAVAKTVAELTSQQDGLIRQQVIEQLIAPGRRFSP